MSLAGCCGLWQSVTSGEGGNRDACVMEACVEAQLVAKDERRRELAIGSRLTAL